MLPSFGIKRGYTCRTTVADFDPWMADEAYQKPVYDLALKRFRAQKGTQLVDWGCGTGTKMVERFKSSECVGVEVSPRFVRNASRRHTLHLFVDAETHWLAGFKPDVLICADVIEHVENPHLFMERLREIAPKLVVISTPAREHIVGGSPNGPPTNPAHAREWTMPEFKAFMRGYLVIKEHTLIDPQRATQCVVGRFK